MSAVKYINVPPSAVKAVAIASDHAGFELKELVAKTLKAMGYTVEDFGTKSLDSCDYPDYARLAAQAVSKDGRTISSPRFRFSLRRLAAMPASYPAAHRAWPGPDGGPRAGAHTGMSTLAVHRSCS